MFSVNTKYPVLWKSGDIMRPAKRIVHLLKHTGAIKLFIAYIIILCISGFVMMLIEPNVNGFFEGIYFCFVASSTIGFGDIVPVTAAGRCITVFVTLCGILTAAVIPGIIVTYYTEYLHIRQNETISTFLEKLEDLPNLSKEELEDLSERVKAFNRGKKKQK